MTYLASHSRKSMDVLTLSAKDNLPATRQLVALHGWGANYHDLVSLLPQMQLEGYQYLFPNAPFPHPQVPEGRAWYALESQRYEGLLESRQLLKDWLLSLPQSTGIPLEKTVLLGFSQGGAMTLDIGLELPLAGLCSLSGYLHLQPHPQTVTFPPVLMIHGIMDQVVPLEFAHEARDTLMKVGVPLTYHELKMGHDIPIEALSLTLRFIEQIVHPLGVQ